MIEVGQMAPAFSLPDGESGIVHLLDFRGSQVVIYFYPKDATPGCTQEACDFRDLHTEITGAGAVILGISPDPPRSHEKFAGKYALPFKLLSDQDSAVATAYGVWQEKSMYGRTYLGIVRSTFLIDAEGKVKRIWPRVKVAGHAAEVLAALLP